MAFSGAAIPAVSTAHACGPNIALTVTRSDMQSKKERALSRRYGSICAPSGRVPEIQVLCRNDLSAHQIVVMPAPLRPARCRLIDAASHRGADETVRSPVSQVVRCLGLTSQAMLDLDAGYSAYMSPGPLATKSDHVRGSQFLDLALDS